MISFVPKYLALLSVGSLSGLYVGGVLGDWKIAMLDGHAFTQMHQARDEVMRRVMPPVVLAAIALVAASALVSPATRGARLLVAALLVVDMILAIRFQVPLNRSIASWSAKAPPGDWARVRDRWFAGHAVRTGVGVTAFAILAAVSL